MTRECRANATSLYVHKCACVCTYIVHVCYRNHVRVYVNTCLSWTTEFEEPDNLFTSQWVGVHVHVWLEFWRKCTLWKTIMRVTLIVCMARNMGCALKYSTCTLDTQPSIAFQWKGILHSEFKVHCIYMYESTVFNL